MIGRLKFVFNTRRFCSSLSSVIELAKSGCAESQFLLGNNYLNELKKKKSSSANSAEDVMKEIKALIKQNRAAKNKKLKEEPSSLGLEWLELAGAQSHHKALCLLGNVFMESMNECDAKDESAKKDLLNKTLSCYESAALLNNSDALYNLGNLYYNGVDCQLADGSVNIILPVDFTKSLAYFNKAAELGDSSAKFWLGYCFFSNDPCIQDFDTKGKAYSELAFSYLSEASQLGHDQADYYLGMLSLNAPVILNSDSPVSIALKPYPMVNLELVSFGYLLRNVVEHSNIDALTYFAQLYFDIFFEKSIKDVANNSEVIRKEKLVTCCLVNGRVLCNDTKEFILSNFLNILLSSSEIKNNLNFENSLRFTLSISNNCEVVENERKDIEFICRTGYFNNDGPSTYSEWINMKANNYDEYIHKMRMGTLALMEKATALGSAHAALTLGSLFYHGMPGYCPRDYHRSFQYYNIAAEAGSQEAWKNVASMYMKGEGVAKSESTAKEILRVVFNESDNKETVSDIENSQECSRPGGCCGGSCRS